MFQGFGDGSILPEDLQQDGEEEEEPELILDGGLPRYASSSLTSDLLPMDEGREMAVDEEVERGKEEEVEEGTGSLPRKPPPSWEEWKLASSGRARGAEEVSAWSSALRRSWSSVRDSSLYHSLNICSSPSSDRLQCLLVSL